MLSKYSLINDQRILKGDGGINMKKFLMFFMVSLLLFFIINVNAAEKESEEYIIQKGDTLWGISNSELEDTFLWPKLWSVNPGIENPDLIYPGAKIWIPSLEELMRIPSIPMRRPGLAKKKPKPKIVYKVPKKPTEEYIVDKTLLITSGWIADEFPGIGELVYSPGDRKVLSKNDFAYLKFPKKKKPAPASTGTMPSLTVVRKKKVKSTGKYYVIRDIKLVKHPETGAEVGRQIRVLGILEVIGTDSEMPKAKISSSYEDINIGDSLLPYYKIEPPIKPDIPRSPNVKGQIIESHLNSVLSIEGSIIFLDKGRKDGLRPGDVFSVFSDPPTRRPIGTIQIVSLQPSTSGAVIMESEREILIGANWGQRKYH